MRGRRVPLDIQPDGAAWLGWWTVVSLGLHGLILAGILSLDVTGPPDRASNLRVRLVTEGRQLPEPPLVPKVVPARKSPRPQVRAAPEAPAAAPTVDPGVSGPPAPDRPHPGPDRIVEASPPVGPSVATPGAGAPDQGVSPVAGPPGEGEGIPAPPRAGPGSPPSEEVFAPTQLEAAARGVFLIPGGGGGGTGRAGIGAADQGVGTGAGGSGAGKTGQGDSGPAGSAGTGWGGGAGSGDGVAGLLQSIRRQIEQAKIYPEAARRGGIQGTVELRFRIAADGSAEVVEILRSSGFGILDEASQQTIRRAAPYPLVRGWIRLPLSYRLDR